ncbi:MAG: class I SAM-dependent methyltransferase [Candidatus Levyibacteriota bacterium]
MSLAEVRKFTYRPEIPLVVLPSEYYPRGSSSPSSTETTHKRGDDPIPPENHARIQLDRSIGIVNYLYQITFGHNKTPLQTATDIARRNGIVDLLDVGCGTGNTVRTWGMSVAKAAALDIENVSMTGVSLYDYRNESSYPATLGAHRDGTVRYIVGDAANMKDIDDASKDVVLANASLIYSEDPVAWMEEMLRVTKPGGVLYFDLSEDQNISNTPIMEFLFEKADHGHVFDNMPVNIYSQNSQPERHITKTFCRLEKPVN